MTVWVRYARAAGRSLARAHATMDDFRMWHRSAQRYAYGFRIRPPLAVERDALARWWARWLPWVRVCH